MIYVISKGCTDVHVTISFILIKLVHTTVIWLQDNY